MSSDVTAGSGATALSDPVATTAADVELRGVTKRFDDNVAVEALDLHVAAGEFLVLLGPSGCGKSTALRIIAGLEEPSEGTVLIDGEDVTDVEPRDRDVAMVFQSYALYPHMTVRRNIEYPLRNRRVPKADRAAAVEEVSAVLGLDGLLERRPVQLSGGQRQRVALARAIVRRPAAFLMDEPLSNLDAKLRVQTRAELIDLQRRFGATVVYVTHDQVEAMTMGHRIAVMVDGTLQQVDTPAAVHARPANVFVAGFIGTPPMNLLDGHVVGSVSDGPSDAATGAGDGPAVEVAGARVALPPALAATVRAAGSRDVVVGIRPEHVAVDPDGQVEATVTVVEALGHENHVVTTTSDGQTLTARTGGDDAEPPAAETIRLRLDPDRLHLFDRATGDRIGP